MESRQVWFLLGLGCTAVVLHETLRWPLGLPGRHGIELMATLLLARCLSNYRLAATVATAGAASTAMLTGAHGAVVPVDYLLMGLVLDLLYGLGGRLREQPFYLVCIAAGSHFAKGLCHWLLLLGTGRPDATLLRHGLSYVSLGYLGFGLLGGLAGVCLVQSSRHLLRD